MTDIETFYAIWIGVQIVLLIGITAGFALFFAQLTAIAVRFDDDLPLKVINGILAVIGALIWAIVTKAGLLGGLAISLVCAGAIPLVFVMMFGILFGLNYGASSLVKLIREYRDEQRARREDREE